MSAPAGMAAPKGNISGYKLRQTPNFSPQQMQLFQQLLGGLMGGGGLGGGLDFLSKLAGGDEEAFAKAEAPAYSAFNKAIGQLGSRFSGFGSGALDSSAFQQATSGAAGDLAQNLQAQRLGMQNDAISRLLGLSQNLLSQRPYENFLEEKGGFDWGGLLGGAAGSFLGPFGGALGKGVGSAALPKVLKLFGLG